MTDAVMSALGMFSLKAPSLLKFDSKFRHDWGQRTLKNLFKVEMVPSDTQMRDILDELPTSFLHRPFKNLFEFVRQKKHLKAFSFLKPIKFGKKDMFLLAVDATGFFSSKSVRCPSCIVKRHSKREEEQYHHQLLAATIVHPELKTVLPLDGEPIENKHGAEAQDSELVAFKRLLVRVRELYPKLGLIVTGDSLYACGTVIKLVERCEMAYIFSVKEGRTPIPIRHLKWAREKGLALGHEYEETIGDKVKKKVVCRYSYMNGVALNNGHDIVTNILEYEEMTRWICKGKEKETRKKFCWLTNIPLRRGNIDQIMRGGRSRWKIENETFNTLKNQGYNIDHNYGHGKKNLAGNFALLTLLAFAVDQIQEMNCDLFKMALKKCRNCRSSLWELMKSIHHFFVIESWEILFIKIAWGGGGIREGPL